jgi:cation-transporting P-type ATPase F
VSPPHLAARGAEHSLPLADVVLLLGTDPDRGLAEAEARGRLHQYGPNALPVVAGAGPLVRLARQLNSPLVYVLLVAGAVTMALGETVDATVILAVVAVNTVVGYVQETRAEGAMDALRRLVRTEALVVRDGHRRQVVSTDLAPGDVVLLQEGDKVPADLRLVREHELRVDESALTGESLPVDKDEVLLPESTEVADRRNMLYSGTLVTGGSGAGVVVRTGAETQLGEIHRLVGSAEVLQTPLTRKLARFSRVLTVLILVLAGATFAVGLARGLEVTDTFTAAVALAVGAIPEGLPAAITIALAIGMTRMARRRAVIRRLPAVETLGSVTVVCSDKTGTLTENQMTVRRIWTPDREYTVTGSGYAPEGEVLDAGGAVADPAGDAALRWSLVAGAACTDADLTTRDGRPDIVGDPTEGAMLVVARKAGLPRGGGLPARTATLPFTSERRFMATLHPAGRSGQGEGGGSAGGEGEGVVLVKGGVERVLDLAHGRLGADGVIRWLDREEVLAAAERLAAEGLRVLATAVRWSGVAARPGAGLDEDGLTGTLVFTGLQAMLDPPRAAAVAAVRACASAGIEVKMITGDHAATATAVARQLDLLDGDGGEGAVLTGRDLATLSDEAYGPAVERATVFARVSPDQKLRLVRALQHRGAVVAMTGDGVNDAPALRQADIGIAMGRGGTEVAKDAGDMVLTDDDFGTIEAAVEEGRGVFDNLTKFIVWTLPTNMAEGAVILVAIAMGATLPILPTQILWINMTTAVALGLMLAFEPTEPDVMRRPPRRPDRPLLTVGLLGRVLLVSVLLVGATLVLFRWQQAGGADAAEARTAAVNLFVAVEIAYLFSCRTLDRRATRPGLLTNRWILGGVAVQVVLQLALTYLPALNGVFGTAPIDGRTWLRILLLTAGVAVVIAVDKRIRGHRI